MVPHLECTRKGKKRQENEGSSELVRDYVQGCERWMSRSHTRRMQRESAEQRMTARLEMNLEIRETSEGAFESETASPCPGHGNHPSEEKFILSCFISYPQGRVSVAGVAQGKTILCRVLLPNVIRNCAEKQQARIRVLSPYRTS